MPPKPGAGVKPNRFVTELSQHFLPSRTRGVSSSTSKMVSPWPQGAWTLASYLLRHLSLDPHQVNLESTAFARTAPNVDSASMVEHNTMNHGEPQPRATVRRLSSEERIEDPLHGFVVHAMAGIAHR